MSFHTLLAAFGALASPGLVGGLRRQAKKTESHAEATVNPYWGLERIGAAGAQRSTAKGRGVHIYVVSSGIRQEHQDFGGRAAGAHMDFTGLLGRTIECDEGDRWCAQDKMGIGTQIASAAAGTTFGVAPEANLIAVKVISDLGNKNDGRTRKGLNWIVAKGSRPAVALLPDSLNSWKWVTDGLEGAIEAAIAAGVTVVTSVGGSNNPYNACTGWGNGYHGGFAKVPGIISVAATGPNNEHLYSDNYGECVDLYAPGKDTIVAKPFGGLAAFETGRWPYTEISAAYVAGAAAMVLERHPDFGGDKVLQKLLDNACSNCVVQNRTFHKDAGGFPQNKLLYVGADAPPPPGNH